MENLAPHEINAAVTPPSDDAASLAGLMARGQFPELWRAPELSAAMLNKSDVARDTGVAVKTISEWVSVLQASGQIVLLEPWHVSFGKRVAKTPKVYFRDSGLLCFLLGLDASTLLTSPALGAVWETFVFAEMRKLNEGESAPVNFWYYRDQRGQEVDFVRDAGGVFTSWSASGASGPPCATRAACSG